MAKLAVPSTELQTSFLTAMAECAAEGRGSPDDHSMIGHEFRTFSESWHTPNGFAEFVGALRADALEETPRSPDWVPCTTWWWIDQAGYVGRVALRHRLNPRLFRNGDHIGSDVRPTARRQGHATAMLRAVRSEAAERGITSALVTCDVDNVASIRVIQRNGGVLENELDGTLRFWVSTA